MFRGIPSSHCRFVPKHLQVALALSHQARDGLEAVPEGKFVMELERRVSGFSSLFSPVFSLKSRAQGASSGVCWCLVWGLCPSIEQELCGSSPPPREGKRCEILP